jgi:hypothetical protein
MHVSLSSDFMQQWRRFRRSHGRNHSDVNGAMAMAAQAPMVGPNHSPSVSNRHHAAPMSPPQTSPAPPFHRRSASGGKPFTLRSQGNVPDAMNPQTPPQHRRQRSHQTISSVGIAGLNQEPMDLS